MDDGGPDLSRPHLVVLYFERCEEEFSPERIDGRVLTARAVAAEDALAHRPMMRQSIIKKRLDGGSYGCGVRLGAEAAIASLHERADPRAGFSFGRSGCAFDWLDLSTLLEV